MAVKPTLSDSISKDDFLKALYTLKLRAEKQTDGKEILDNFVKIIDFDSLINANTQIIYGRNGTGKTHLLKAFYQYSQMNFEETRIIPIYIDFKELALGPNLPSITLDDLIIRFYRRFIGSVTEQLNEFAEKVITISQLERFFGGESKERRRSIEASLEEIDAQLNFENFDEKVRQYTRKIILDKEGRRGTSGGISAGAKVSLDKPELNFGSEFGISAEELSKDKETIELIYEGLGVIDYRTIQLELENIIKQCGSNAIVMLIDEWSSIELSIQPLLADMILKTIGVSNKIFLKIATVKYFTRTSSRLHSTRDDGIAQRIGYKLGIDITVLADLDQTLNFERNPDLVKYFLSKIAYKHSCQILPTLKEYSVQDFLKYLEDEVFSIQPLSIIQMLPEGIADQLKENGIMDKPFPSTTNVSVYDEVVRASEGNPRDYLGILSACCAIAHMKPDKKISVSQVILAASDHFTNNKAPGLWDYPEAITLYNKIFQRIVQKNQKLFLISLDKAEQDKRIQELWHYRFIHLINPHYIVLDKDYSPIEYQVFSMDYGKLLSLKVQSEGERILNLMVTTCEFYGHSSLFGSSSNIIALTEEVIKLPMIGRSAKHLLGSVLASLKGVEKGSMLNVDYLVQNCVIDDLLA